MMAENSATDDCPGYRTRVNGHYTHICDACSNTSMSGVNFSLQYQGSKDTWRDGVNAAAARQVAEARARGIEPEPVGRGRWV